MFLYKISNPINGKSYIGATTQKKIIKRLAEHKSRYKNMDYPLYLDMRKYGFDIFKIEIISKFDNKEDLYEAEQKHILSEPNLYNITLGGKGIKGYKFSEENKRKMSNNKKGRSVSKETREKLSLAHKGKSYHPGPIGIKRSEETKRKISKNHGKGMLGKKQTESAKRKWLEKRKEAIENGTFGKLRPCYYPDIKKLKEEGVSYAKIAVKYKCTPSAVYYFIKRTSA